MSKFTKWAKTPLFSPIELLIAILLYVFIINPIVSTIIRDIG
jgi:hypothetical protein